MQESDKEKIKRHIDELQKVLDDLKQVSDKGSYKSAISKQPIKIAGKTLNSFVAPEAQVLSAGFTANNKNVFYPGITQLTLYTAIENHHKRIDGLKKLLAEEPMTQEQKDLLMEMDEFKNEPLIINAEVSSASLKFS